MPSTAQLIFSLLLFSAGLSAQTYSPPPPPPDIDQLPQGGSNTDWQKSKNFTTNFSMSAGPSFAFGRRPLGTRITSDGTTLRPGFFVGTDFELRTLEEEFSLVLGIDLINDRAELRDYQRRSLVGELAVEEFWLRWRLGFNFGRERWRVGTGVQLNSWLSSNDRFLFTETITELCDRNFDCFVLDEPVVRRGISSGSARPNNYFGFTLDASYRFTPRLSTRLRADTGLHLFSNYSFDTNRFRRMRADVGLVWRLF